MQRAIGGSPGARGVSPASTSRTSPRRGCSAPGDRPRPPPPSSSAMAAIRAWRAMRRWRGRWRRCCPRLSMRRRRCRSRRRTLRSHRPCAWAASGDPSPSHPCDAIRPRRRRRRREPSTWRSSGPRRPGAPAWRARRSPRPSRAAPSTVPCAFTSMRAAETLRPPDGIGCGRWSPAIRCIWASSSTADASPTSCSGSTTCACAGAAVFTSGMGAYAHAPQDGRVDVRPDALFDSLRSIVTSVDAER